MYRKVQESEESLQSAYVPRAGIGFVMFGVMGGVIPGEASWFSPIEQGFYTAFLFYLLRFCLILTGALGSTSHFSFFKHVT